MLTNQNIIYIVRIDHLYDHYLNTFRQKKPPTFVGGFVFALPIFPGSHPPSIVGVHELNFCVRDGNRWTLMTINTNYLKGFNLYLLVTHTGFEPMLTAWEAAVLTTWPMGHLVHLHGLEPGTHWLRVSCSTNWAKGAGRFSDTPWKLNIVTSFCNYRVWSTLSLL